VGAITGEANYLFFYSDIMDLCKRLRDKGILIRDCGNYAGLKSGGTASAVRPHDEKRQADRGAVRNPRRALT
jgi:threonine-phosphate decarboxylase